MDSEELLITATTKTVNAISKELTDHLDLYINSLDDIALPSNVRNWYLRSVANCLSMLAASVELVADENYSNGSSGEGSLSGCAKGFAISLSVPASQD